MLYFIERCPLFGVSFIRGSTVLCVHCNIMAAPSHSAEVNVRSDVQVARMITDRKRRHYVSLYTGSFIPYQQLDIRNVIGEGGEIVCLVLHSTYVHSQCTSCHIMA